MCGRYASYLPPHALRAQFGTSGAVPSHAASYNVAPMQDAMVVRQHPVTRERRLDLLQWGLVPGWTPDLNAARKPTNARCETASSLGMFRHALAKRRCLVPADAFYEWRSRFNVKQPFAIARADGDALAFAGLWEIWQPPGGEVLRTFCILTCAANAMMQDLHPRMPVVLEREAWPVWLSGDAHAAQCLMRPAAADVLRLWPVSRAVDDVWNSGPALLNVVPNSTTPPPSVGPDGSNPE